MDHYNYIVLFQIFSKKGKFLAKGQGGMHLTEPHGIAYDPVTARLAVSDKTLSCVFVHDKKGKVTNILSSVDHTTDEDEDACSSDLKGKENAIILGIMINPWF